MSQDTIRWSIYDVNGNEIVLKENTFYDHVKGDHAEKDSFNRLQVENQVKDVLQSPIVISKSEQRPNDRVVYIGQITLQDGEDFIEFKNIKIVVDISVDPWEVVTWIIQRRMKIKEGDVLYVRTKL